MNNNYIIVESSNNNFSIGKNKDIEIKDFNDELLLSNNILYFCKTKKVIKIRENRIYRLNKLEIKVCNNLLYLYTNKEIKTKLCTSNINCYKNNYKLTTPNKTKYKKVKINVEKREEIIKTKFNNKQLVTPLLTLFGSFIFVLINPNSIYMLISIITTTTTLIITFITYITKRNRNKKSSNTSEYINLYNDKVLLKEIISKQNISLLEMKKVISVKGKQIYERQNTDKDYLVIRIGSHDKKIDIDNLSEEYKYLNKYPKILDLKKGTAIVEEHKDRNILLDVIINTLLFYYSYNEINIVILTNDSYYFKYKLNKQISFTLKEADENTIYIVCKDYILNEEEISFLENQKIVILCVSKVDEIFKNIENIIIYKDKRKALLIKESKIEKHEEICIESHVLEEKYLRKLSSIKHIKNSKKTSNYFVSLEETLVKISNETLNLNWSTNNTNKEISVFIGKNEFKKYTKIDFHENEDGPHGILAGTTGSGKSEILKTIILSLCYKYNPYLINFILIDYKGGSFSDKLISLPHVVGVITNLDNELNRALISLQSEIKKRQEILRQEKCDNCYQTNKLTNLFIIVDEFAQLKQENPEFISNLVSISRIGRSLGIHLILSTQKPFGIIDDEIRSNTNLKLCLKVENEYDSKDVIKTSDAAHLKNKGDCYIATANKNRYELFKFAYAKDKIKNEDQKFYVLDKNLNVIKEENNNINVEEKILNCINKVNIKSKNIILPPLKEKYTVQKKDNKIIIGVCDDPYNQDQYIYKLNNIKKIIQVNGYDNLLDKIIKYQCNTVEVNIMDLNKLDEIKINEKDVLLIKNINMLKNKSYELEEQLFEYITKCNNLIFIFTNKSHDLTLQLKDLINIKFQFYDNDKTEYYNTIGNTALLNKNIKNRFLIKQDNVLEIQLANVV